MTTRGERVSNDNDEERATVTTSKYWGFFGLVLIQRLYIGFFFFLINTFVLEFVLLLLCIDCIGVWFSLLSLPTM